MCCLVKACFNGRELTIFRDAVCEGKKHFLDARKKGHPTMNDSLRDYYGKIQQHFKGGLSQKVQPSEYQ